MSATHGGYYLPQPSYWPIVGSIGLFLMLGGFAYALQSPGGIESFGELTVMFIGMAIVIFMMFGWFGTVVKESVSGAYNEQVDRSFRMAMIWFIFSEVMFFAAFFGALFYIRMWSVPWLGGEDIETHLWLAPAFDGAWPTAGPGEVGDGFTTMGPWGIPAINTLILLTSGVTVTLAHWALKKNNRGQLVLWLFATVVLGIVFLGLQAYEYIHAYTPIEEGGLGLTLEDGVYGSTFFMLTGFHGFHVFVGATMLVVILLRAMRGHFSPEHHFAFEAAAWYWHFVDVVWLGLFIFVYWLV